MSWEASLTSGTSTNPLESHAADAIVGVGCSENWKSETRKALVPVLFDGFQRWSLYGRV